MTYDTTSLVHPAHPVPEDIVEAFATLREQDLATVQREHDIAALTRPTAEERRLIAESRGTNAHKPGLRELGRKYAKRLEGIEIDLPIRPGPLFHFDPAPAPPAPVDPSFWWARTDPFHPGFYRSEFRADGLHFIGKFTYDDGDLFGFSLGATAMFGIDWERLPHSPSGRWRSAPHVELFGGLLGWTGPYDLFDGDSWCKVWLHRRQTVFQWGFGPSGPVQQIRGQAGETQHVINEENAHRTYRHGLHGFHPMPAVEFGNVFPGTTWAQLDVRFDVQLEGNSFLWLDPDVLLRTFQWPVTAV